jgi:hypothetical protein
MKLADPWVRLDALGRFAVATLLISGAIHLPCLVMFGQSWEDPASFRKPILFGLSTGLTLWSLLHCLDLLRPRRGDRFLSAGLSLSLLVEVLLITVQAWRHRPSHFNRSTALDATIETSMGMLIAFASSIVLLITLRAWLPHAWKHAHAGHHGTSATMQLALRWGLVFLTLSCVLGFVITQIGHYNQLVGRPPEIWPARGILKFPHGAALHAIQTLAIFAWWMNRWSTKQPVMAMQCAVAAHAAWLAYATLQTFRGYGRWEWDSWGLPALLASIACTLAAIAVAIYRNRPIATTRTEPSVSNS